ncbi:cellulose biosynthesis protein BcsO [Raoultella sp. BIGb0138]|uniref:cellulose biosynthesis protein BcsO n=1 Tax=Raoultella sp. BIGb0138 TaxID=2485115 RepID=UPI00104F1A0D|nr:cellulose biosynthesis protein BcsO [Raoultella sp. BIGb0138]TCW14329.1 cellulose biosynthesis protein BcsO [Raoultella sp. BIGb0138]
MNHYDDLQRFKEKTGTQSLHFRDLSSQAVTRDKGDWVILNQLTPGAKESSLAMGGSVSLPLPQQVPADLFHRVEAEPVHSPSTLSPPVLVAEPITAAAATPAAPVEPTPVAANSIPAEPIPAMAATLSAPSVAPRPQPTAATEGYAHLFAAKTAEPVAKNKDQPLKSLLERIATCR